MRGGAGKRLSSVGLAFEEFVRAEASDYVRVDVQNFKPCDISNAGRWKYQNTANRKSIDWSPSSSLGTRSLKLCFPSHGKLELEKQGFPSWSLGTSRKYGRPE
ncbi:MAG: hypothetical protein NTX45_05560 [Proteobacteria bacterium]|nr:hypothetical protein [Pseudomonadota bacterium]